MRIDIKILVFLILQLVAVCASAKQIDVKSLAFSTTENQNKLIFTVSEPVKHRVFVIDKPPRLVVEIKNAKLTNPINLPSSVNSIFSGATSMTVNAIDLKVMLDLKTPVNAKEFSLISNNVTNHLIVELNSKNLRNTKKALEPFVNKEPKSIKTTVNSVPSISTRKNLLNSIIIAIDAGHGGSDPGAQGVQGTEEKAVTLQIAKKLEAFINEQSGFKAVMVRTGDDYVGLRERMKIAREAKADLFISIHADAGQDTLAKGASVYTLSTNGASSEAARWLADTENAADMVGVSLHDKEDDLASTLFDLTQKDTREESIAVANHVLKSFKHVSHLHKNSVQKAGFMVLKSPDIPSILIETAFISNPAEEQNLLSQTFQTKIAKAIFKGLSAYFEKIYSGNRQVYSHAENERVK